MEPPTCNIILNFHNILNFGNTNCMDKGKHWQYSEHTNVLRKSRNSGHLRQSILKKKLTTESSHLKVNTKTLPHYFIRKTSDISPNTNIKIFFLLYKYHLLLYVPHFKSLYDFTVLHGISTNTIWMLITYRHQLQLLWILCTISTANHSSVTINIQLT